VLSLAAAPDAAALVGQLGANDFTARVEAVRALEQMGAAALPALDAARDAEDPRIRLRLQALREAIARSGARDRLTRPTELRLDFHDRPLIEVIAALNDRYPLGLILDLEPDRRHGMVFLGPGDVERMDWARQQKITLEAPLPVPFWHAIDGHCRAARLTYDLEPDTAFGAQQGGFRLVPDRGETVLASDSGPYRVHVVAPRGTRDGAFLDFPGQNGPEPPAAARVGKSTVKVRMVVVPEPGLLIRPDGAAVLEEAIDDSGRALELEPVQPAAPQPARNTHPLGPRFDSFEHELALRFPTPSSRRIARLRGTLPVTVVTRRPGPLVIPLKDAEGRSYGNDEVTIQVHELKAFTSPERKIESTRLEATVRWNHPESGDARSTDELPGKRAADHLRLADALGHEVATGPNHMTGINEAGAERVVVSFLGIVGGSPDANPDLRRVHAETGRRMSMPVELRYYALMQTTVKVRFDFRDIPIR
jgi:hypothetical protein